MRDRLQPLLERRDVLARLGVDLAEQPLAEVRQGRGREAADEALRADDSERGAARSSTVLDRSRPRSRRTRERRRSRPHGRGDDRGCRAPRRREVGAATRLGEDRRLGRVAVGGEEVSRQRARSAEPSSSAKAASRRARLGSRREVAGGRQPDADAHGHCLPDPAPGPTIGTRRAPGTARRVPRRTSRTSTRSRPPRERGDPPGRGDPVRARRRPRLLGAGGPKTEHDVDFFVTPENADQALEAFARAATARRSGRRSSGCSRRGSTASSSI